jgi:hypothetical protein
VSRHLRNVKRGDPLVIPAATFNAFVAAPSGHSTSRWLGATDLLTGHSWLSLPAPIFDFMTSTAFSRTSSRPSAIPLVVGFTGTVGAMPTP